MAPRTRQATRDHPTSLTDWLRTRTNAQLVELLRRRPDLGLPTPNDLATLASRIGVRTSVRRAVDGLDAFTLGVLSAVVLAGDAEGPLSRTRLDPLLPDVPERDVTAALDELRAVALVWGSDDHLHPVSGVVDTVGAYPAGLGRPAGQLLRSVPDVALTRVLRTLGLPLTTQPAAGAAVRAVLADPVRTAALLSECSATDRAVLDRLAAGPPVGVVRETVQADDSPLAALIDRALLIPLDAQTVELPREVGLVLRGGQPLGTLQSTPPAIPLVERAPAELDRLGTTAVLALLRLVTSLGDAWSEQPPAVLRSGGLGARELKRAARELDADESTASLVIEVATAAGLLAATHTTEPVFLPTPDFDGWRTRDAAERWVALAAAWLAMTRDPSLVGQRDERDRLITPLGPDAERGTLPTLRHGVLALLAEQPPGSAPVDPSVVLARLAWQAPRRAGAQAAGVSAILAQADQVGVTAAGGITGYGRALLAGAESAAADAVTIALPEPVDHFLVQPDLTVVVPGPPTPDLATEISAVADLESTGGASVYRVTETSVRRALDTGRSGADLVALFAERSRTPVPQGLRYLIEDVARRHGLLRTGVAAAYLRCDDEALLTRVLSDRSVEPLGLRRIAPTVVISTAPVARILDVLRTAGYAPSAESPEGAVIAAAEDAPRAPLRPGSRLARPRTPVDPTVHLTELVRRMRAGDELAEIARRAVPLEQRIPGVTTAATLGLLREAIRADGTIWLGYVDSHGTASQRSIRPISMAGGTLRGHDVHTGKLESFQLHHITAVSVLPDDGDGGR